ncbi:hypothetical protein Q5P01_006987 [Channa striata]|uniref:Uncharacterized protein n=1 Tax=Channa striata TaxID=64152 RepID=A0AA88SWI6_CHASR|nr:hypothetical protein Q5P01_006987 [Channa striata]
MTHVSSRVTSGGLDTDPEHVDLTQLGVIQLQGSVLTQGNQFRSVVILNLGTTSLSAHRRAVNAPLETSETSPRNPSQRRTEDTSRFQQLNLCLLGPTLSPCEPAVCPVTWVGPNQPPSLHVLRPQSLISCRVLFLPHKLPPVVPLTFPRPNLTNPNHYTTNPELFLLTMTQRSAGQKLTHFAPTCRSAHVPRRFRFPPHLKTQLETGKTLPVGAGGHGDPRPGLRGNRCEDVKLGWWIVIQTLIEARGADDAVTVLLFCATSAWKHVHARAGDAAIARVE